MGKPRDELLIRLHDRYADRLNRMNVRYAASSVADTRGASRYTDDHVRERESATLLAAVDSGELPILLDRRGESWSTDDLARRLEREASRPRAFLIGGPLGFDDRTRASALTAWSLSALTLTHEMARVLVAEQLYRAACLHRGHPYHR